MRLAVIPARGGSKRIPGKNLKRFGGRPMISWSIEAALASGCFDRVVVSTDSEEIAQAALAAGAEVPFMRPPELSDDHVPTVPVVAHALQELGLVAENDLACCIYATAPFITIDDLREGLRLIVEQDCDYVFSLTSYGFPIQRALRMDSAGRVAMFHPEHVTTRSQDLEESFHDAGQFYWGRASAWLEQKPIFASQAVGLRLPRVRVQDIDTAEDWQRAEAMFRALKTQEIGERSKHAAG